jgi:CelD/BcsL family acetyltransferase involved in cellulose biosynthesis
MRSMSCAPSKALTSRLTCTVITDPARLEEYGPAWSDLLERSASNEPMLSPAWLLPWWQVYGPRDGRRLQAALFHDEGRLVGLAPLLRRRHWYRPGIPFRRLEPLGSGEREADALCSVYLNVIAERGAERQVAREMAAALAAGTLGPWDEFVLPMMDGTGPMPALLTEACTGVGLHAEQVVTGAAPYIALPPTWDAFVQGLGKKGRYFITRSLRDFEQWAGSEAQLERVRSADEVDRARRILIALHHERWKDADPSGVFQSPLCLAFHDAAMPRLFERGALEILWLSVRGEPVAALYNIVWKGKVYYYQCGRRLDVPGQVRVGGALLAQAIRAAIEAGRREFDFLPGLTQYKKQLTSAARPIVQVRAVRNSLVEQVRRLAERGIACARAVRNAARRAFRRPGSKIVAGSKENHSPAVDN